MGNRKAIRVEDLLERIEFPGEDRGEMTRYLNSVGFTEKVMNEAAIIQEKRHGGFWILFTLLNLFLLIVTGANHDFLGRFLSLTPSLVIFFFLFLGVTTLGGIIGLILNLDTGSFRIPPPVTNLVRMLKGIAGFK